MTNYTQLSDEKLLGMVISESSASTVLDSFGSLEEAILHAIPDELTCLKGVGEIQASRIKAVAEITRRIYERPILPQSIIQNPNDVFIANKDMQVLKQEHIRVMCLNTKNGVLTNKTVIIGGIDRGIVEPREIFQLPVKLMAKSIIIVHNHPSGDPTPSQDDISLTAKLQQSGEFMAISLLDHIIIGKGKYFSLKEHGHL